MLNNIYFLRHCKTEFNAHDFISGGEDISIIENEIDICDLIIADGAKVLIISSPLKRCVETIELLKEKVPYCIDTIFDNRLVERNMGDFQGKARNDAILEYPTYFSTHKFNIKLTPPHGESFDDFFYRVNEFSTDLLKKAALCPIIISSHNQTLKLLYAILNKLDINYVWSNINFANGKITKIK